MRPNFKNIDIKSSGFASDNVADWAKQNGISSDWMTPELIPVKSVYTKDSLAGMEDLNCVV